jgi:hypothetical protein
VQPFHRLERLMDNPQKILGRVELARMRNAARDRDHGNIIAIRRGDYEHVAPGLFNTSEFDKPLIANLIDTTARDIAEVMAPLPAVTCQSAALSNKADGERQDLRGAIANSYIQGSRLQDQMFGGADRYGSFGFMAYCVEPDFRDRMPVIRVDDTPAYYVNDYRGRTREYFSVFKVSALSLVYQYSEEHENLRNIIENRYGKCDADQMVEVVRWYDDTHTCFMMLDPCVMLTCVENVTSKCPVRVVERPSLVQGDVRGQFDDVIWVQIARALVQVYTMNALEQSVHAPLAVPKDADEIEIGPFSVIQTDNPGQVGRVNLNLSPGLFPEFNTLAQEQRMGSRYPEGRSGSIDASVVTGQGVQALMGTFDTQVQTFQRLNASALEDVVALCFEMDERLWGGEKKTRRLKDNGAPRKIDYTPAKDINGDYTVDVSYGAIAGLDPNRGLVFVLQALAGGLISKLTAMKSLPVDMNPVAETRQIELEQMEQAVAAALSQLPLAIPQMAMGGADPREVVLQITQASELIHKGKSPTEAIQEVFAPKPKPEEEAPVEPSPLEQAQGAGEGPAGLPGAGSGGASDLLMSLAGMTPSGKANLQANVSRMRPVQG